MEKKVLFPAIAALTVCAGCASEPKKEDEIMVAKITKAMRCVLGTGKMEKRVITAGKIFSLRITSDGDQILGHFPDDLEAYYGDYRAALMEVIANCNVEVNLFPFEKPKNWLPREKNEYWV